jgi:predicted DNA-binding transcriptional regulator AlpA
VKRLLTTKELAEKFQLPEKTLADWRSRGIGPPYMKMGKHVRYEDEASDAWAAEQAVAPRETSAA